MDIITGENLSENVFNKVYKLMEESFPAEERRTYLEQKALLDNPQYCIYTLPDSETNDIKAFIAAWKFADFVFIEHFAVNPVYRNGGIGSCMLQEVINQVLCRICLEVELPDNELAKRRIGFYERNGFVLNHYPYIQPSISKGQKPLPLLIMTTDGSIAEEEFQKIRKLLYKYVYHASEM